MHGTEVRYRFRPPLWPGVSVAPDVQRITARNPSPFTFHGTNSYIVGRDTLAVIDPGPDDEAHLRTLLEVIAGRPVSHIFVSHTHRDHSPLAARLKERTGAIVLAEGPHRPARALHIGETTRSTPVQTWLSFPTSPFPTARRSMATAGRSGRF